MPSPGDNIGVLRELPCTKNNRLPTSALLERRDLLPGKDWCVRIGVVEDGELQHQRSSSSSSSASSERIKMLAQGRNKKRSSKAMTARQFRTRIDECLAGAAENVAVVETSAMYRMLARLCLDRGKELEACCHLIASHALCFRQQILYRNLKSKLRTRILSEPLVKGLDPKDLDTDHYNVNTNPSKLMSTLKELPTEWYLLQITAEHEHLKDIRHRMQPDESLYSMKPVHSLHVVALPTGKNAVHPVCVTLPKPNSGSTYDIRTEIESLLNTNKSDLTAVYNNNDLYWKMRKKQNDTMSTAISELEFSWLREWRILLIGDYLEQLDLVKDIHNMIDKLVADSSVKEMPERNRWLLKKIATGACYLQPFEIEKAVKYILPTQAKLAKNIILSIVAKTKVMDPLKVAKRKTLILILDECLDHISFESLSLLKHQPVTRFPSLHITYALYKQHKESIKDGFKIVRKSENFGTFIVNPSLDLTKMEVRIKSFLNYWLPKWDGLYGIKPDLDFFKKALTQFSILMYNGHGSGIQFLRGEEIERMRVLASVLLFGCGSIKLLPVGGRQPAYGVSNQYLMSCSPCILGMLWEVTDGDIDKMTTEFMSSWIMSMAKRAWSDVDQTTWSDGVIAFNKGARAKIENEHNMLVAVAKSKDVCKQYMTSAAIVVRGLPLKLVD